MRAYQVDGNGLESLRLVELPDPVPGPGEVLVAVDAVSLNYRDLMVAEGRYGRKLERPMIPCSDMAGTVRSVGEGVCEFKAGDRVLNAPFRHWPAGRLRREYTKGFIGGGGIDGTLAELMTYPAASLVKVPAYLSQLEASTITVAGLTAWSALVPFGRIRAGDWVLIHGTGGVSVFAMQLARLFGARTIVTTAREEKAKLVRDRYGVAATVNYRDGNWPEQVLELTKGDGADIVVDVAGGETLARSLDCCAYGARIAIIGLLDHERANLSVIRILSRQLVIGGIYMDSTEELRSLVRAMEAERVKPHVHQDFNFTAARAAYECLRGQSHVGKVAIQLTP